MIEFSPATQAWFDAAFAAPTAAQSGAWDAIGRGENALVVAPTGSGKTLAAFLWSLDRLSTATPPAEPRHRCRVVYVSPLKALAVDVDRNLRAPLSGIRQAAARLDLPLSDITVGTRTGDTPAAERRALARRPPDILITTPESLFLVLTSAARESLRGVDTVIVDEIHAVCGTKRGAHLALTLERLDALTGRPAQRIGLSATVRPVDEVATLLAGGRPVTVVRPPAAKSVEVDVVVPVDDMTAVPTAGDEPRRGSIWPAVEEWVLDLIGRHRSTIVFANSRRQAERFTTKLNELSWTRRHGPVPAGQGAQVMAQSGSGTVTDEPVARAHHGSVSRERRTGVEEDLKAGRLPAVVATSSLELGIDMGAVDLVVQVGAPPSVAAGLQRVGRAGHQVGAVSRGVVFPRHRGELVEAAVIAERMRSGLIEEVRYPRNPLDVLAQQIVAMVAMEPWPVDRLTEVVKAAAPFAGLPDSALEAVLDMLAGRYPSDAFAELRPRIRWDRTSGTLFARPGAHRLAVTSGGTIPDRGLFGVFLAGEGAGRRVGELDEEMVYESRVGDVFLLGTSSWRIEDIGPDRVLVSPAPGQPGRMPFWNGDSVGRPAELGRALGGFLRELSELPAGAALARAAGCGLDERAGANLVAYLSEQRQATGYVPSDRTIVVERFRDELGDWRVCAHSPFGARVNAPWALLVAARLREAYGVDALAMHSDDGIVLRVPVTDAGPPPADLVVVDPDEVEALLTEQVSSSALFAARFRECAARSLLLPKRDPRRRSPLWQQRRRSADLLRVAGEYAEFPVVLEAMRECLRDVFDVPGLVELMRDVAARRVRVVEVETSAPSPFARTLVFGYVGLFVHDEDAPLAERRAHALALDSTLLAELLGQAELRELLEPDAVAEVERELTWLTEDRRVDGVERAADLLRVIGDLTTAEAVERGASPAMLAELEATRRAVRVRIAGSERWIAIEDAGRVRDALGVALPVGVPEAFTEPVRDPLGDLVSRYARTHGPFGTAEVAARYGLGRAVVDGALRALADAGRVVAGEFRPGGSGPEWCDAGVLRRLRRRSLAALRHEVEPVPADALARFLPAWHQITRRGRGVEAVAGVVDRLAGAVVPASALETLILPARVDRYSPAMLDELTAAGEVVWAGAGALPGSDGWVCLVPADAADTLLPPVETLDCSPLHQAVLDALDGGQALFFRALSERVTDGTDDAELARTLWDLVFAGLVTNDTLGPLRARLGRGRRGPARPRYGRGRYARPGRAADPAVAGRWSRLPDREPDPTRRAHALAEALLDRHGVVAPGSVGAERIAGGFGVVYPVLRAFEEAGRVRRGYFVESLGAAQFAVAGAVDRLRGDASARREVAPALVLAATDPANPYGAVLPWPARPGSERIHRPGRKAGALVVLVDGALVLYVERGGRSVLTWGDSSALPAAADALALTARECSLGPIAVERVDGGDVLDSPLAEALAGAGFTATPRGLRLRG